MIACLLYKKNVAAFYRTLDCEQGFKLVVFATRKAIRVQRKSKFIVKIRVAASVYTIMEYTVHVSQNRYCSVINCKSSGKSNAVRFHHDRPGWTNTNCWKNDPSFSY